MTEGIISTYMINKSSEVFYLVTFLHLAPFFFLGNYYVENLWEWTHNLESSESSFLVITLSWQYCH